jgi:eukaryotic translation initiation factor 2-alpha kinase 4
LRSEDLISRLARAVGRAGTAASHVKRYDIDRVFHKSMAGGHPRESMEASFDIIYDENARLQLIETEVLHVAIQAMSLLPSHVLPKLPLPFKSPLWYIRLGHTRLADSILDICSIPIRENLRRACFHILSKFLAPAPHALSSRIRSDNTQPRGMDRRKTILAKLDDLLIDAGTTISICI